jgi:CRP-like cAMP-binding protein
MSLQTHIAAREPSAAATRLTRANRLIASLPEEDYRRLSPFLRHVGLHTRQMLQKHGQPIQEIVFPVAGVCSVVKTTEDGHAIELFGIGREGAVGAGVAWGVSESPADVMVQISDTGALSLPVDVFKGELLCGGALASLVSDYCRLSTMQLMQASACNALHSAEQRCCRWLLTTLDRVQATSFPITQELLAMALGVRRPTVTLIMADLHRDGLVTYARGRMTIVDRSALQKRACECYESLSPGNSDERA